jgi:hypothetical protein
VAKLHEEVIVIKVSKLIKDAETAPVLLDTQTIESLEAVVAELVGSNTLVEIQVA